MRLLLLLLLLLTPFILGCNTENPLCTDNYCVEGEIYPRSELVGDFSLLAVDDSVILATLVGGVTPVETVETPAVDSVSLADIVSNVEDGGTKYLNQTVTITGEVELDNTLYKNGAVSLITGTTTAFYIADYQNPARLNPYKKGKTYTFTVIVVTIRPPNETFDTYAVFSDLE